MARMLSLELTGIVAIIFIIVPIMPATAIVNGQGAFGRRPDLLSLIEIATVIVVIRRIITLFVELLSGIKINQNIKNLQTKPLVYERFCYVRVCAIINEVFNEEDKSE